MSTLSHKLISIVHKNKHMRGTQNAKPVGFRKSLQSVHYRYGENHPLLYIIASYKIL